MMDTDALSKIVKRVEEDGGPRIEFINSAPKVFERPGVFASSFNPPTVAHFELMHHAAAACSLDHMIALASIANADKADYECPLEDRLRMLLLGIGQDWSVSVGLSSEAFFIDHQEALAKVYPEDADLHFIMGFDTFVRVLDRKGRYVTRYRRRFKDRKQVLDELLSRSRLIVAGRGGAERAELRRFLREDGFGEGDRVIYLDFPPDLAEMSATEVRNRVKEGLGIGHLVAPAVERYILDNRLYRVSS